MKSLRELYPHLKLPLVKGGYGIEIEAETKSINDYPRGFFVNPLGEPMDESNWNPGSPKKAYAQLSNFNFWKFDYDQSIRNFGAEFVLSEPLDIGREINNALGEFRERTKTVKFIEDPPGCSVHAHLNMGRETFMTMANFVTLWTFFENILVAHCGPGRSSNVFALPMRAAEGNVANAKRLFQHLNPVFDINEVKYGALNFHPLSKFGSLEIRCMRGTTDVEVISNWIDILERLVSYSRNPKMTPLQIFELSKSFGILRLAKWVFGDQIYKELLEDLKALFPDRDPEETFQGFAARNLWYVGSIAECQDWPKVEKIIEEKNKKTEEEAKAAAEKSKLKSETVQYWQGVRNTLAQRLHTLSVEHIDFIKSFSAEHHVMIGSLSQKWSTTKVANFFLADKLGVIFTVPPSIKNLPVIFWKKGFIEEWLEGILSDAKTEIIDKSIITYPNYVPKSFFNIWEMSQSEIDVLFTNLAKEGTKPLKAKTVDPASAAAYEMYKKLVTPSQNAWITNDFPGIIKETEND